jgi:transposase
MRRWPRAGSFERIVEDVQSLLRQFGGRKGHPTAVCLDSRTLQPTPESDARAGRGGAKRRKGSKVHTAADTLGHLMALTVTPADQGDRAQLHDFAQQIQHGTGNTIELAYVDLGDTGPATAEVAQQHGIRLDAVKRPMAKRGFIALPRRWVVERSFVWAARFRRLARDDERRDTTLRCFHYLSLACLMLARMFHPLNKRHNSHLEHLPHNGF